MSALTYKYKLKGKRAIRQLKRYAYATNQVWNYCVQTHKSVQRAWKLGLSPKWLSFYDLKDLASGTSKDLNLHSQTIQNICDQFVKSRDLHKKCPRFRKSNGSKRSLGWIPFQQQSRKISGNSITYLGNTYRFFGAKRRPLPPITKGGSFVEDSRGYWYVCFHVEVPDLPLAPDSAIGIDLGLKSLAVLSNGKKIPAPQTYRCWEHKLAIAQRANNKQRTKAIHAKISNTRKDHLHKLSHSLASQHRTIFVGNVSSSKLAKTNLAKSIYDASWSTLRSYLRYKVSRHEGTYLEVDEKFTTQICSSCQTLPKTRPKGIADLGIRDWVCSNCLVFHDRDINAAKNILNFGLSAQPLAEGSRVAR